ncbi:MAG TPA: methylamine dehydrogenase accessory protein MauD [Steroidobacteraceae bacterium]|nr:methylamine dehydrogenase accessory protein MauD [Steroidobacteraceae bacterium]
MVEALIVSNTVLWIVVLVLCAVVLALVRQIGVLHERIGPVGALMLKRGLKVGEPAPALRLTDLGGRAVEIGIPAAGGKSMLLVFVSPTCPVCKTLLPVLKSSRLAEGAWLEIVLASDGAEEEQRRFIGAHGLKEFAYVLSTALGLAFQVDRLPFAALVDEAGILRARGIINSREHLESLFEAKRRGVASLQEYLESHRDSQVA